MYVKVINNRLNSFQEHRKKLHHMQNFVSLGVGKPVSIIDVYGKTEENKEQLNESIINPAVKINFITDKSSEAYKALLPQWMLFNLRDIKDDFNNMINKWYDVEIIIELVFNLYFDTLYKKDMYLEKDF